MTSETETRPKSKRSWRMEEALSKAKAWLEKESMYDRKWLSTSVSSYDNDMYEITLHVLEGSPSWGRIVEDSSEGSILAISKKERAVREWRVNAPGGIRSRMTKINQP